MSTGIDELLADARIPTSSAGFDVAAGLRRLAADTAGAGAGRELARVERARRTLAVLARWALARPDAAERLEHLVEDPDRPERPVSERLDVDGALVFACLLYLTGHTENAQFWWQLAAGAGHRAAAYCLHLHHLERGEPREARHWLSQATSEPADPDTTVPPPVNGLFELLEVVTRYVRAHGPADRLPIEPLEAEVGRLAVHSASGGGIILRPDRRLVRHLAALAERH
ncbi:hypothetical protein CUT44_20020 [Streptomyces carminius]|uniref:Sel1 repeat family protein n=1 Tax=Streptomyces carminius TaxID=2665496 RepID=A0A2M8LVU5_9ACTN|nr:hypothetical protein [Streptomyces carminius]PJE96081.1 hypothetical protein CUT44_20020 [Streptomyces carminius]